jgi:hypothetical protein
MIHQPHHLLSPCHTQTTPSSFPTSYTNHTIFCPQIIHKPSHLLSPDHTQTTPSSVPRSYTNHTIFCPQIIHKPHHLLSPDHTQTTPSSVPMSHTNHTIFFPQIIHKPHHLLSPDHTQTTPSSVPVRVHSSPADCFRLRSALPWRSVHKNITRLHHPFSPLKNVRTRSGVQPAPYSVDTGPFPKDKVGGGIENHPPPSSTEVKSGGSYNSAPALPFHGSGREDFNFAFYRVVNCAVRSQWSWKPLNNFELLFTYDSSSNNQWK